MSLYEELLAVQAKHGTLTAAAVVEDATPDDSPLHHRFEWDDSVAGHQHRLAQARGFIRSVKVAFTTPAGTAERTRAFVSVQREEKPERTYLPVRDAATDQRTADLVLRDAEREWRRLFTKYQHLSAFVAMVRHDLDGLDAADAA